MSQKNNRYTPAIVITVSGRSLVPFATINLLRALRVLNVAVLASSAGSCGEDRRTSAVGIPRTSNLQLMSSPGQSNEIYALAAWPCVDLGNFPSLMATCLMD